MRPAIYIQKATGKIISFPPTDFGVMCDETEGTCIASWGARAEPIKGSLGDAIREQGAAMIEEGDEKINIRIRDVMRGTARGIIDETKKSIREGQIAVIREGGKIEFFDDPGDEDEALEIDGIGLSDVIYSYDELHNEKMIDSIVGNLAEELANAE